MLKFMFNQKHISEFKKLFKDKYEVEFTDDEVEESMNNLISLIEIMIKFDAMKRHEFCINSCPILT